MKKQDKVKLLNAFANGKKPAMEVWILHTPFGIIDTERNKKLQPNEIAGYIKQLQQQHPLYNVVHRTLSLEDYNRIAAEIEATI